MSVTLIRRNAGGPVSGQIGAPGAFAVAGTITGKDVRRGLLGYFLRDKRHFLNNGGYRIAPGPYEIRVSGGDANGAALNPPVWGPAQIASHALVDEQFSL